MQCKMPLCGLWGMNLNDLYAGCESGFENNVWFQAQTKWMVAYGEDIHSDLIQMA